MIDFKMIFLTYWHVHLQVREGGYDQKVNETVNVVTAKTTEIGHKTWGIVKGVMAMASQKVEEYSKDGITWNNDNLQRNDSERNGYYQEFNQENKGYKPSSGGNSLQNGNSNSFGSSSWDDWDVKDSKKEEPKQATFANNDSWAGWDDPKEDSFDDFYQSAPDKSSGNNHGKSSATWTGGGFL